MLWLSKRYFRSIGALVAFALLLAAPLAGNLQRVSALHANHMGGDMHESCAVACAQLGGNAPQQAMPGGEEIRTPNPTPRLLAPYFVQFLHMYEPKVLRPAQTFGAYTIRPPDIVALTMNYRF